MDLLVDYVQPILCLYFNVILMYLARVLISHYISIVIKKKYSQFDHMRYFYRTVCWIGASGKKEFVY